MESLDKPRPAIAVGLIAAGIFVGVRGFLQYHDAAWRPAGHPWPLVAHVLNMVAVCALAARWARPQWKKTAMTVALLSALLAFVAGHAVG